MGVKVANDISERTHQICSQKLCILLRRVATKDGKRIAKFEVLANFLVLFGRLTW